jgi:hypothetical protein
MQKVVEARRSAKFITPIPHREAEGADTGGVRVRRGQEPFATLAEMIGTTRSRVSFS